MIGFFPIERDPPPPVKPRRRYDGSRRAEGARRTRRAILDGAHAEFAERGYAGATIRGIAERAQVSVKTVEAAFSTKANVLKELIDVLIAGDDEPVAILDRDAVADMIAEPDAARMLELNARFIADINRRLAVAHRVLEDAAGTSDELAELHRVTLDNRLAGARAMIHALATKAELRVDLSTAVDIAWALFDPHLYHQLTSGRGWAHDEFVEWFTGAQRRLLLA